MKKQIIILILLILLLSCFHCLAVSNRIKTDEKIVRIYQISPTITPTQLVFYKQVDYSSINPTINIKDFSNDDSIKYIIITIEELRESITTSNFIPWKESKGFDITLITISDPLIQGQNGNDLPQKIREFLREYYNQWNIKYLLIIGDIISIPMRYCYPDPMNHRFSVFDFLSGEIPTDYYYADLTLPDDESWDRDKDGYYGEYQEDQPDFDAEIYVGRIPTSDPNDVTYTLDKIVGFEQADLSWKQNALHAGAFFYFDNEDYGEIGTMDGAVLSHYIEQDIMSGWKISHYSEQEGLQISQFAWDILTEENFINDWQTGKYCIVNWQGHG